MGSPLEKAGRRWLKRHLLDTHNQLDSREITQRMEHIKECAPAVVEAWIVLRMEIDRELNKIKEIEGETL